jgi:type I restriction enzyme S subunit
LEIPLFPKYKQIEIVSHLDSAFIKLKTVKQSLLTQLIDLKGLSGAIIYKNSQSSSKCAIGSVATEVKNGIGELWKNFPVFGATRNGLALARERPGKHPERYKPVSPGSVFYNPMRILIGSIAYVEHDEKPGITSPDYVVVKGKDGLMDSRWFYYWLRSPMGERCINSLARGAVRERMLFNRLAEGEIELPDYDTQVKASKALEKIKPMRVALQKQLKELELMPQKLLSKVFEN